MQIIVDRIKKSLRSLKSETVFINWFKNINAEVSDIILINNTFVYRHLKTIKNIQYLGFQLTQAKSSKGSPVVLTGLKVNSDLKLIKSKALGRYQVVPLETAVKNELKNLGELVFILIGYTDDTVKITESVNHKAISTITLDPTLANQVELRGNRLFVKETFDEESIWQRIIKTLKSKNMYDPTDENLRVAIGETLDKIEGQAVVLLHLPSKKISSNNSVIDSMVDALKQQRKEYSSALKQCGGDSRKNPQAFNDILRIAYNFASDATTFIRLIVCICDLKAIILWASIGDHFRLSEAFKELPWYRSRNKPSLNNYHGTIADARNAAFHMLFPFRKTIKVRLSASSFQDITLKIFSEYRRRFKNELLYHDKELVDVLMEFTRAGERRVAPRFWKQNLTVMDATIKMFKQTAEILKLLRSLI
jgi:hypothetical protein